MLNEDQELLQAVDKLMSQCQPHLNNLMLILHDRNILQDPNLISLYALGVFADEYSHLRSMGDYEKDDIPMSEIIVEMIVHSHLAIQQDERMQQITASMMVDKVDKVVEKNERS